MTGPDLTTDVLAVGGGPAAENLPAHHLLTTSRLITSPLITS
ncbi:hypothetical protein [Streptomyces yerevanensis]|nr:hypothetical protein [Streptomyces yerevanensis]